jgi:hypothetical protein
MSSRAIVLIPATATPADLLQPIAGVPALLRLLLCAQRASLGEILLLGVNRYPRSVQASLTQDSRLTARLVCLDDQPWAALVRVCPDLEKAWWEGDLWVLPAGGASTRHCSAMPFSRGISPIAVIDPESRTSSMSAVPFFRVSGAWLQPMVQASGDVALSAPL